MKVFFPYNSWRGGFISSIQKSFEQLGCKTSMCSNYLPSYRDRILRKISFEKYRNKLDKSYLKLRDAHFLKQLEIFNPDYLFMQNCGGFMPETLNLVQKDYGVKTISYIVDAPCSNNRSNYAVSLRFNDIILNPEDSWNRILYNLAPNSNIYKFYGGYDPENFYPVEPKEITDNDIKMLSHDIVFTGGSYGQRPEGAYRAGILGQLAQEGFNVSIYGDEGWKYWSQYYPMLFNSYKGERMTYINLRKMLSLSKIYINMPSPQISTSFQPRIFELAASKCFQILDYSKDYADIFEEDRIATFKNFNQLKEKIEFYLKYPDERQRIVEYMYSVVSEKYTYHNQLAILAKKIGIC